MFGSKHMLKQLSGGLAVAAFVVVAAVPSALAGSFITDTLGGNGSPKATPDAFERAVAIHNAPAAQVNGTAYVNGGMSASVATSNDPVRSSAPTVGASQTGGTGFSWVDAGIGAGFAAGLALLLLIGGPRLRPHKSRVLAA
jgi:hypothetical protein